MNVLSSQLSSVGKLFLGFLGILFIEGALRKWGQSSVWSVLPAVRDTICLIVVIRGLRYGFFSRSGQLFELLLLWTFSVIFWGLLQLLVNQSDPIVFLLGLRFWLLYLWFAIAVGLQFRRNDVECIASVVSRTILIMTPLAVIQHLSDPSSFINIQPETAEEDIFLVANNIVRVTGTFTFTLGYTCYLALVSPYILGSSYSVQSWGKLKWISLSFVAFLLIATAVSGSRAAILFLGGLLSLHLILELLTRRQGDRAIGLSVRIVLLVLSVGVVSWFFEDATSATILRFEQASESEVFYERMLAILFGEPEVRSKFIYIGYGIGAGTNIGGVLTSGFRSFSLAESEPGRILLEGGLLGLVYIFIKASIVGAGSLKALKILNRQGYTRPLLLWVCVGLGLLTWPISGQISAHGFCFAILGLAIAETRLVF